MFTFPASSSTAKTWHLRWQLIAVLMTAALTVPPVVSSHAGTSTLGNAFSPAMSVLRSGAAGVQVVVSRAIDGVDSWLGGGGDESEGGRRAGRVFGASAAASGAAVFTAQANAAASMGAGGTSAIDPGAVSTLATGLSTPTGVAVDGSTAYVGTSGSILAVNTSTGAVTTLAGGSGCSGAFGQVYDVALDASYVYASSQGCGNWLRFTRTSRSTGATTDLSISASGLAAPLTVVGGGLFLLSSSGGVSAVVRYDLSAGTTSTRWSYGSTSVSTITGEGADLFVRAGSGVDRLTAAGSSAPVSFASVPIAQLTATTNYVYASNGSRIARIARSDGSVRWIAGADGGNADGTGTDAWFGGISGIGTDGTDLFVADELNSSLRKVTAASPLPAALAASASRTIGANPAQVSTVGSVTGGLQSMTVIGNFGYVVTSGAIRKVDLTSGAVTTVVGSGTAAPCFGNSSNPASVTIGYGGASTTDGHYLYFVDNCFVSSSIRRLLPATGAVSTVAGVTFGPLSNGTFDITFGADGNLYATAYQYNQWTAIVKIDPVSGSVNNNWLRDGTNTFRGITADANGLWVYEISCCSRWISYVTYAGVMTQGPTLPGNANGLTFDLESAGKYLYSPALTTVERYTKNTAGTTNPVTIAGSATSGSADGVGINAQFGSVADIASDGKSLYAVDSGNGSIRLLLPGQYPHDGLPNEAGCDCQNRGVAAPVDVQSGNFYHSFADIGIPGRSGGIGIERTYSAASAAQDGFFGFGWSSPYSMRLEDGPYSTATGPTKRVMQENSTLARFSSNGTAWVAPSTQFTSLVQNGDGTWTFTRRARERFVFNAAGQLIKVITVNGFAGNPSPAVTAAYTTTLNYGFGFLGSITDPAGRALTVSYGTNFKISKVQDPTGRHVDYSYNSAGELTDVTDVAGGNWHFTYDPVTHWILTMRNPRGKTIATNIYDDSGRVTSQTDALGRVTTFDYTSIANSVLVTEPPNNLAGANKTLYTYDTAGTLVSETHGYGSAVAATWSFEYDPSMGGLTKVTDPNGHFSTNTFDASGNRLTHTDALSHTTTSTYDALNDVLTVQDPNLVTTTFTYDAAGNMTTSSTPLVGSSPAQSQVSIFWHTDSAHPGDVVFVTDPSGQTSTMTYDTDTGDVLSTTSPTGDQTTTTYDTLGRVATTVAPKGNAAGGTPADYRSSFTVNAFGDVRTATDPLGHVVTRTYDEDRNVKTVKDAKNQTTTYTYDDDDQLTSVLRPDTTTLGTDHWPDGSLKSQTDGNGKVTNYTYDEQARLATMVDPLSRTTTYGYDGAGNQTTVLNPSGQTTLIGYDNADRRSVMLYSDGVTPGVIIGYDADDQRTGMLDGTGSQSWVWDSLHRLSSQTDGAGQTVGYGYDLAGRKTSITYATGKTVTITPDASGRTHTVADWLSHTNTFDYDRNSNLTTSTFGNADVGTNTFDNADQLTGIQTKKGPSTLANWVYTRDNNNLLAGVTSTGIGPTETYTHNGLDQLATQGANSYSYDTADNLTQLADGTRQSFDAANQLCWTSPTTSTACTGSAPSDATRYGYDGRGNRTTQQAPSGGQTGLGYDQADRVKTASVPYESGNQGQYTPILNAHILDTRSGSRTTNCYQPNGTSVTCTALTASTNRYFQVTGLGGVPSSNVDAVAVAVTAFSPPAAGYIKMFSSSVSTPSGVRDFTYASGATNSTGLIVKLGSDGRLAINSSQALDVTVEVLGYYTKSAGTRGGVYQPVTPAQVATGTLSSGSTATVQVTGNGGVPAVPAPGGVAAAVMELKVTGTTASGWAQIWEAGQTRPTGRNLSYLNADTATEMIITKLNSSGQASLYTSGSGITYTLRVLGYYTATPVASGALNVSQTANRVSSSSIAANSTLSVQVTGNAGVPSTGVRAVTVVATALSGTAAGDIALGNTAGTPNPTVTVAASEEQSNTAIVQVDADGKIVIKNNTSAARTVYLDVIGWQEQATNTWTYTYDGDGLRTKKTSPTGTVTTYLWDHSEAMPLMIGEQTSGIQTYWINGPDGVPVEQVDASTARYLQHDQIGSTRLITDQTGNTVGTATYNPYGRQTGATGFVTPIGFTGQYTDPETGNQYLRARYYDPATGQFLTRDPIAVLTRSAYGYTANDPLNSIDPQGLAPHDMNKWKDWKGKDIAQYVRQKYQDDACAYLADQIRKGVREVMAREKDYNSNLNELIGNARRGYHDRYYISQKSLAALWRAYELLGCEDLTSNEEYAVYVATTTRIEAPGAFADLSPDIPDDTSLWLYSFSEAVRILGEDMEPVAAGE